MAELERIVCVRGSSMTYRRDTFLVLDLGFDVVDGVAVQREVKVSSQSMSDVISTSCLFRRGRTIR